MKKKYLSVWLSVYCQMSPDSQVQPQRDVSVGVGGATGPPAAVVHLGPTDPERVVRSTVPASTFSVTDLAEHTTSTLPVPSGTKKKMILLVQ